MASLSSVTNVLVISCVFLAIFVQQGLAIRCFVCTGPFDPGCDDPFDGQRVPSQDCAFRANTGPFLPGGPRDFNNPAGFPIMCKKRIETVAGQRRVTRDCASQAEVGFQGQTCQTHADGSQICYCNYDNCNGAFAIKGSPLMALVLTAIALFCARKLL